MEPMRTSLRAASSGRLCAPFARERGRCSPEKETKGTRRWTRRNHRAAGFEHRSRSDGPIAPGQMPARVADQSRRSIEAGNAAAMRSSSWSRATAPHPTSAAPISRPVPAWGVQPSGKQGHSFRRSSLQPTTDFSATPGRPAMKVDTRETGVGCRTAL